MEELKELQSNHLLKYLATILSYKTYLAWQVVHEKEANDEDLLKMEQLKRLPSNHPLKCLETDISFKIAIAWRIINQKKANGEDLLTMEKLKGLQSIHPLKCLETDMTFKIAIYSMENSKPKEGKRRGSTDDGGVEGATKQPCNQVSCHHFKPAKHI